MEPLSAHSKREWILVGMAECCAAKGYEQTSVEDVCGAAGVDRAAFEELFAGKADCLAAAMEMALGEMRERLSAGHFPKKPWAAAVRDGVVALLGFLAEHPALARMALIEVPAAGGRAAERYATGRAAIQSFLERGRDMAAEQRGIPASASRAALAGAEGLVIAKILAGETRQLGGLADDVAYMLTVPYMESPEALREASRQTPYRHLRAVA